MFLTADLGDHKQNPLQVTTHWLQQQNASPGVDTRNRNVLHLFILTIVLNVVLCSRCLKH
jgi:hypothetical protein